MYDTNARFKRDNAILPRLLDKMYQDRVVYKENVRAKKSIKKQKINHIKKKLQILTFNGQKDCIK